MKKILLVITLAGAVAISACNTVKGAGQDLQSASDSVKNEIH